MANTLVNPSQEGTRFYTSAGAATSGVAFASHKVKGGAMMMATSTADPSIDGVSLGKPASVVYNNNLSYRGMHNGVLMAYTTGDLTATVGNSGGYCGFQCTNIHQITANTFVQIGQSDTGAIAGSPQMLVNTLYGMQKATGTVATHGFTTTTPFENVYNGQTVQVKIADGASDFNTMTVGRYVGQKITTILAGKANTALKFGSNAGMLTRSINKVESVRTTYTLTGLRGGFFNRFSGKWETAVTTSDDINIPNSTITSDNAAAPSAAAPGQITFKENGKPVPTSTEYAARTTW